MFERQQKKGARNPTGEDRAFALQKRYQSIPPILPGSLTFILQFGAEGRILLQFLGHLSVHTQLSSQTLSGFTPQLYDFGNVSSCSNGDFG